MHFLHSPIESLGIRLDDGILTLNLNRPKVKNAIDRELYLALERTLIEAAETKTVRVVLICGGDTDFSAGNDLKDFANASDDGVDAPPFRFLRALARFNKPVVCAVKGVAVGIGTTMLLHADIVLCDQNARFALPFLKLGLTPEGASTLLLPQLGNYHLAAELLMLGEPFSAETALRAGIVNHIVADVYDEANSIAQKLSAQPLQALIQTKDFMRAHQVADMTTVINAEAEVFLQRTRSPYMTEALMAFKEKRPARFKALDDAD